MRYRNIKDDIFVNSAGERKTLHGERTAQISPLFNIMHKPREKEMDDFAVEIWGNNAEMVAYKLREQNVERMLCEDFKEREMVEILVPPLE